MKTTFARSNNSIFLTSILSVWQLKHHIETVVLIEMSRMSWMAGMLMPGFNQSKILLLVVIGNPMPTDPQPMTMGYLENFCMFSLNVSANYSP